MLRPEQYIIRERKNFRTVLEMIEENCRLFSGKTAMQMKIEGGYLRRTYKELSEQINLTAKALILAGMKTGEKAALFSENRPEWGIAYFGITKAGGIIIPVDAQSSKTEIEYILGHSGSAFIFVSEKCLGVLTEAAGNLPGLKKIICFDGTGAEKDIIGFREAQKKAESSELRFETSPRPDDVIEILYTSGTTGIGKGVILTQKNIISDVELACQMIYFDEKDTFLSVLPIHHAFECTGGFLVPLYNGAAITYAESLKSKNIIDNIKETNVTIMLGVPLLYEKLHNGIRRAIRDKPLPLRIILGLLGLLVVLFRILLKKRTGKKLFRSLRDKAGLGTIKFFISGGGPLREDIAEAFDNLGITIIQGYGLTETSPIVTVGTEKYQDYRSVGLPLPGVRIEIENPDRTGSGEIKISGPVVMKGYYRNEEETRAVLKDGWLFTGDIGHFDKTGYLHITGRKKNIIVTFGGKNVYPEEIEFKLALSKFIAESLVYGARISEKDRGEKVAAIIVPNYEEINLYAKKHQLNLDTEAAIEKLIGDEVKRINTGLASYKRITGFRIHQEELVKTSTKKIKRYLYAPGEITIGAGAKKSFFRRFLGF